MSLKELHDILAQLMQAHGAECQVFLAIWDQKTTGRVHYARLTHIDPPELEGDGITLTAAPMVTTDARASGRPLVAGDAACAP